MIRSENARPSGWVFVDLQGRDLGGFVQDARQRVAAELGLGPAPPVPGAQPAIPAADPPAGLAPWVAGEAVPAYVPPGQEPETAYVQFPPGP